jgi:hypothetical protein
VNGVPLVGDPVDNVPVPVVMLAVSEFDDPVSVGVIETTPLLLVDAVVGLTTRLVEAMVRVAVCIVEGSVIVTGPLDGAV